MPEMCAKTTQRIAIPFHPSRCSSRSNLFIKDYPFYISSEKALFQDKILYIYQPFTIIFMAIVMEKLINKFVAKLECFVLEFMKKSSLCSSVIRPYSKKQHLKRAVDDFDFKQR
jgi:hypothetical protein